MMLAACGIQHAEGHLFYGNGITNKAQFQNFTKRCKRICSDLVCKAITMTDGEDTVFNE